MGGFVLGKHTASGWSDCDHQNRRGGYLLVTLVRGNRHLHFEKQPAYRDNR